MNLLALLRRVAPPVPRADPVDPPSEVRVVDRARAVEDADAAPVWEVPGLYRWEGPDRCELAEEDRLLDEVAVLVDEGASPWDAALSVFGEADETPGTAGAGLYASLAGEPAASAPR